MIFHVNVYNIKRSAIQFHIILSTQYNVNCEFCARAFSV